MRQLRERCGSEAKSTDLQIIRVQLNPKDQSPTVRHWVICLSSLGLGFSIGKEQMKLTHPHRRVSVRHMR